MHVTATQSALPLEIIGLDHETVLNLSHSTYAVDVSGQFHSITIPLDRCLEKRILDIRTVVKACDFKDCYVKFNYSLMSRDEKTEAMHRLIFQCGARMDLLQFPTYHVHDDPHGYMATAFEIGAIYSLDAQLLVPGEQAVFLFDHDEYFQCVTHGREKLRRVIDRLLAHRLEGSGNGEAG